MNPFRYGRVVSAEDFCPRPNLLRQMTAWMRSGRSVVLQGERRMGKTSLIYEAARRIRKCRMLYIDLLEIKTADDLCRRMAKTLISMERQAGVIEKILRSLARLRPTISIDPLTGEPSISLDAAARMGPDSIEGLFDLLRGVRGRLPFVMVFDEFQDILNLPDSREVLAVLRGKIQLQRNMSCVFAGSVRNLMGDIFSNPDSAFFKSAISMDVGPLDAKLFSRFLREKFALGKRKVDDETLRKVFEIAESVPGDVQELCEALWETSAYKDTIRVENLKAALDLIHAREARGYEAAMVQLTAQQMKCLMGLARMGGRATQSAAFVQGVGLSLPASVKKALDRLIRLKIVYRHQGEHKFVNPFFKSWLLWKNY